MRCLTCIIAVLCVAVTCVASATQGTVEIGQTTGLLTPNFVYSDNSRRIPVKGWTVAGDIRAGRWLATGSFMLLPHNANIWAGTLAAQVTPLVFGPIRPDIAVQYRTSADTGSIFSGIESGLTASSRRRLAQASIGIGPGGYNRSHLRIVGTAGTITTDDSLRVMLGTAWIDSPAAIDRSQRLRYYAVGPAISIRTWGLALDGKATWYLPRTPSALMPRECYATEWSASYITPWHVGIWASGAQILGPRTSKPTSLLFLDHAVTYGITIRVR